LITGAQRFTDEGQWVTLLCQNGTYTFVTSIDLNVEGFGKVW
jgi:hypothetical protein